MVSTIEEDLCVTSAFFNNAIFGRLAGGLLFLATGKDWKKTSDGRKSEVPEKPRRC